MAVAFGFVEAFRFTVGLMGESSDSDEQAAVVLALDCLVFEFETCVFSLGFAVSVSFETVVLLLFLTGEFFFFATFLVSESVDPFALFSALPCDVDVFSVSEELESEPLEEDELEDEEELLLELDASELDAASLQD